jgi:hypothetical protein
MADRPVTHSRKDQYGNIAALGNPNGAWSVRSSSLIISDIQSGTHTYYVPWQSGRTDISVVRGPYGQYLRTDRDNTSRNNLDDLPGI